MRFASRTFRRKLSRKAKTRKSKQKRQRTRRSRSFFSRKIRGGAGGFGDRNIPADAVVTKQGTTDKPGAGMPDPVSEY